MADQRHGKVDDATRQAAGVHDLAVQLLIQAVEQVPNLQFLVNAAKAIFALMDKKGWDEPLAARAVDYLQRAQRKDRKSAKVASARELYVTVAKKYGIATDNT